MDDENRRRLQFLYDSIDADSGENGRTLQEAALAMRDAHSNASVGVAATTNNRLLQQNLIQQELSRSSIADRLSRQDPMRWQIRNDPTQVQLIQMQQQLLGLDNYPANSGFTSTGSQMTGMTDTRQRIEQLISSDLALPHGYTNPNPSISAEMIRSLQQQKQESKAGGQRNQHREVMLKAALNLNQQHRSTLDINSLLGESNITSTLPNLENFQYAPSVRRQLLSPLRPDSGSTRLFSEADVAQLPPPSDNQIYSALSNLDVDLGQRILMDDYLRSQERDRMLMTELDPAYQKQQFDELNGQSNRLALLLHQRQRLEMQMRNEFNPSVRNISLKNDEADVQEQPFVKIRKVETYLEKPKRPLSAYNIFFREQRQLLLGENDGGDSTGKSSDTPGKATDDMEDEKPAAMESDTGMKKRKRGKPHHKVTFEQMAKIIGQRWKELESDDTNKKVYQDMAQKEKKRYQLEMIAWRKQRNAMSSMKRKKSDDNSSE